MMLSVQIRIVEIQIVYRLSNISFSQLNKEGISVDSLIRVG